MSGGLFTDALLRETGRPVSREQARQLQEFHAEAYARHVSQVRPLPGALELLAALTTNAIPWAIAARRARALGVGVLSGGYGEDELQQAGAYRVYQDPLDLLNHLDEVGIRRNT